MTALHEILKKIILDSLRTVQPPNGWKVMVVDAPSLKIIESACKMYDILEEKVTLVENIEKTRQPYPQLEAIYLSSPASSYIKSYAELFIDFMAREAQVYSFDDPLSFYRLYSPVENSSYENELRKIAKNLLSICVSLGENPLIRYQKQSDIDYPTKSLSYKLAVLLQAELDQYAKSNPNFPVNNTRPQAVFFVFDRTIDLYTPILHEFTYQAMANDLLEIENGQKYSYNYVGEDGNTANKDVVLDENDNLWVEIRHKHMKDCIEKLMKDFNEFLGENAGFTDINLFEKEKLEDVSSIEQDCATGFSHEGLHPKTLIEDMAPLLDSPVISSINKVRILMLYMMYKNGVLEEDRIKLLAYARISLEENEAINNLVFFGVKLLRPPVGKIPKKIKKYRQKPGDDVRYQISRYVPKLKLVLESHINNTLDTNSYPYTRDPGVADRSKGQQQAPVSLRSENRKPRIIAFVAGGLTYSEIRSAYELTESHNKDVIIGSTHAITPRNFIEDLKLLRNPPTRIYQPQHHQQHQPNLLPTSAPAYGGGFISQPQLQQPQIPPKPFSSPGHIHNPPPPDNSNPTSKGKLFYKF
ncbi:5046_t:CDS:10 [Entrophospora sp. SA101]|nr:5046_t:CDS:10 [Entrophospora sp. SA101]